jgi:uncharacterized membrane protein YdjX (TVP38/TMEM64 family)
LVSKEWTRLNKVRLENSSARKFSLPVIVSVLLTLIPLVTTSLATAWAIAHESELRSWPMAYWVLVTVGLTVGSSFALTPPTFLALVYGYFLGWIAIPLLFALNIGAIAIVFGLSRFLQPDSVRKYLVQVYPQVTLLLNRFYQNQLRLIFFTKLSPVLPFAVTNLFFAMAGARFRQVIAGGTLGMIPRTILAVWAGKEAQDISYLLEHPNEGLGTKIVIIILIVISSVGIGYFFREKKTAQKQMPE